MTRFTGAPRNQHKVQTGDLATYKGNCYLGIDAGSTTTKTALVGEDGSLLYSFYHNNNGSPLATTIRVHQGDPPAASRRTPISSTPAPPVTGKR